MATHLWLKKILNIFGKRDHSHYSLNSNLSTLVSSSELASLQQQLQQQQEKCQRLETQLTVVQANYDRDSDKNSTFLRQTAIADLGQQGINLQDLYAFFDETTQVIAQTLGVGYCGLWELLPNRSALLLCSGYGWGKNIVGDYTIDASSRSYAGYTLHVNADRPIDRYEPVLAEDLEIETRFRTSALLHNLRIVSGINTVIPTSTRPFGVLGAYSRQPRSFTAEETNFLDVVGHILSTAIKRNEYEARLHLLERAIDASHNGILITNALESSNPIIYANQGFRAITGYDAQEVMGRNCSFLQGEDVDQPEIEELRQAVTLGKECSVSLRNYRKNGQLFWNQVHISPVKDEQGHLVNFIGIQADITQYKEAETQLKDSEERLQRIVNTISDGLLVINAAGIIQFVNPAAKALFNRPSAELLEHYFGIPIAHGETTEIVLTPSKGPLAIAEMRVASITWKGSAGFLVSLRNITEQHQAAKALAESEERLEGILSSIQDVVWSTSIATPAETLYLNPATEIVYGRPVSEFYQNPRLLQDIIHPDDRPLMDYQTQILLEKGSNNIEYRIIQPNGEIRWLFRRVKVVFDDEGNYLRFDGIDSDITEKKLADEHLHYIASHDALTNLPNRSLFLDRLSQALQRSRRRLDYSFAVLFLDLDGFKVINDSLGHIYGDQLLQEISQRLQECLRPEDTLARLGGDEFTILVENIHSLEDAILIAERIHQALINPLYLNDKEVFSNTSIGIAMNNSAYQEAQDILRDADTAMYQAKANGKACYAVFDQTMHHHVMMRLQRENDLRRALDRQEFVLYYQPIIKLETGQLAGFEALIRWQHPEEGLLMPGHFITIAEETGLIIPMGQWIMKTACQQLQEIQQKFPLLPPIKMSVNVSSRQMCDPHFLAKVDQVLTETQFNPRLLKLEITESILMDNLAIATQTLLQLRQRQIEISLDDFGTGYSSLSYLHRLGTSHLR